jgi:hypothetical protein
MLLRMRRVLAALWRNDGKLAAIPKNSGAMMRKLLWVVCVLGVPCAALAQMNQASWTSLSERQDVRSVKLLENKHRLRNTLVVGAAGAGVGAAIGAATYKGCSSQSFCLDIGGRGLPTGIGAVIGGVGGVVVGVLLPSRETVYDVGPH